MAMTQIAANKFYAASLAKMGVVKEVIAGEDICDISGTKLWAKGKPIDARLWERLADRALKQPLEACVSTADPLDQKDVLESIQKQIEEKPHFKTLVGSKKDIVFAIIQRSQFNSAELMMLTLLRHGDRDIFDHACAVAAAVMTFGAHANLDKADMERMLHAGMLHDVGELYLDPTLFSRRELSIADQRELLLHPSLGGIITRDVLRRSSNIAYAIEQSHERLDGSGYPCSLPGKALTKLAPALLTAESIIGLLMADSAGIQHAGVALRLNPGEFPQELVTLVNGLAREATEKEGAARPLADPLRKRIESANHRTEQAVSMMADILRDAPLSPAQRSVMTRIEMIAKRCARALNSTGLGQIATLGKDENQSFELAEAEATTREIEYRLNAIARDIEIGFLNQRKPDAVIDLLTVITPNKEQEKGDSA